MNQPPKSQSDWDRLRDGSLDEPAQRRLLHERPAEPDPSDTERLRTVPSSVSSGIPQLMSPQ